SEPVEARPEAVLAPDGKLAHAEPPAQSRDARDALARAAQDIDRARTRMRRTSPAEALDLWRVLVRGRWSLLDMFDHDGRRYLVARRNDRQLPVKATLSPREHDVLEYAARGHSNKLIGYELGLPTATVARYLSNAMQKLGVRSRVEAIQRHR